MKLIHILKNIKILYSIMCFTKIDLYPIGVYNECKDK